MNADPIFIAGAVAAEDRAAVQSYRPAVSSRECELMASLGHTEAEAGSLRELVRDLNALCAKQASLIGQQREELRTLKGTNATPQRGCSFHTTTLGDADVLCEYEFEPASGDGWNEPREPATVTLIQLFINGKWCDAEDILSRERIERIEVEIAETRDDAHEQDQIDAYEANRDWSAA